MSATITPPRLLFTPEDVEAANSRWGANCGPCALAACLGWDLDRVRPVLGEFERRGYLSPTAMRDAIRAAGYRTAEVKDWPAHGLVRIQFGGPWLKPGVPPRVAYNYTHWVACKFDSARRWIYDVNAPNWMTDADWEADLAPRLAASYKRADGTFQPSHCWEVRRAS